MEQLSDMPGKRDRIVTRQFECELAHYTSEKRGPHDSRLGFCIAEAYATYPALRSWGAIRIARIHGADGLLWAMVRESVDDLELVNAEQREAFAQRPARASSLFLPTSVLVPTFPAAGFDVSVARHALHHFMTDSFAESFGKPTMTFTKLVQTILPAPPCNNDWPLDRRARCHPVCGSRLSYAVAADGLCDPGPRRVHVSRDRRTPPNFYVHPMAVDQAQTLLKQSFPGLPSAENQRVLSR